MTQRTHLVLVPGFGAFDVLGQVQYYSGVTEQLAAWRANRPALPIELHDFDNLPSAAVNTRTLRLLRYLVKLLKRGNLSPDDRLVLVGHSTGGLDIRKLLWHLTSRSLDPLRADGLDDALLARLRNQLCGVVFSPYRTGGPISRIGRWHTVGCGTRRWCWRDGWPSLPDRHWPMRTSSSPAHFCDSRRAVELERWKTLGSPQHGLRSLSFATVGCRVYELPLGTKADSLRLLSPCQWGYRKLLAGMGRRADLAYRLVWRPCAGGPFGHEQLRNRLDHLAGARFAGLQLWDNDGVVNTASMLWPDPTRAVRVDCDHLDIVGHYRLQRGKGASGSGHRRFKQYDSLASRPAGRPWFGKQQFAAVWNQVFAFAVSDA